MNILELWKGSVEPASVGASGNEVRSWKGAVEPIGVITYSLVATSIESASEVGSPVLDTSTAPVYSLVATAIESISEVGSPVANTTLASVVRLFRLTGSIGEE